MSQRYLERLVVFALGCCVKSGETHCLRTALRVLIYRDDRRIDHGTQFVPHGAMVRCNGRGEHAVNSPPLGPGIQLSGPMPAGGGQDSRQGSVPCGTPELGRRQAKRPMTRPKHCPGHHPDSRGTLVAVLVDGRPPRSVLVPGPGPTLPWKTDVGRRQHRLHPLPDTCDPGRERCHASRKT